MMEEATIYRHGQGITMIPTREIHPHHMMMNRACCLVAIAVVIILVPYQLTTPYCCIYASVNWVSIGADNGFQSIWHQAII